MQHHTERLIVQNALSAHFLANPIVDRIARDSSLDITLRSKVITGLFEDVLQVKNQLTAAHIMSKHLSLMEAQSLISLWQRMQQDPSQYQAEMISSLVIALTTKVDVPDEVIDEVFDKILMEPTRRCPDRSRSNKQLYQSIVSEFTSDYRDLVTKYIGLLSYRSQASHARYIEPLLTPVSDSCTSSTPMQLVSLIFNNHAFRSTRDKEIVLANVLAKLLKSPHLQNMEWQRIYRLIIGSPEHRWYTSDYLIQCLAESPVADPGGLRYLWRYQHVRSTILNNPNTSREFLEDIIRKLSSGSYARHYNACIYIESLVQNPAVSLEMLAPLWLRHDTRTAAEVALSRFNRAQ